MQLIYSSDKLEDMDFEVLSTDLDCYDLLWEVLLSVPSELVRECIDFITKLHSKLAPHLIEGCGSQIRLKEDFVCRCISYIQQAVSGLPHSALTIERCLSLLLLQCEGEKGSKATSHGARTRGKPITLHVENMMESYGQLSSFKLETHSNETIGSVRRRIIASLIDFKGDSKDVLLYYQQTLLEQDSITLHELDFATYNLTVREVQHIHPDKKTHLRSRGNFQQQVTTKVAPKVEIPPDAKEKAQQLMEIYSIGQRCHLLLQ